MRAHVRGAIATLTAVLIASACIGGGRGQISLTAGHATFDIDSSVVPDSVTLELKEMSLPGSLAAYEFLPDGTQFNARGNLIMAFNMPDADVEQGTIPLFYLAHRDTYEIPAEQTVKVGEYNGAEMYASLNHFSYGWAGQSPLFVDLADPGDQTVGTPFDASALVEVAEFIPHPLINGEVFAVPDDYRFTRISWTAGAFLSPTVAREDTTIDGGNTVWNNQFTCTGTGSTGIEIYGDFVWSGKLLEFKATNPEYQAFTGEPINAPGAHPDRTVNVTSSTVHFRVKSQPFNCTAAAATVTPSPKPSNR